LSETNDDRVRGGSMLGMSDEYWFGRVASGVGKASFGAAARRAQSMRLRASNHTKQAINAALSGKTNMTRMTRLELFDLIRLVG
jgi:hypothetical protein